MLKIALTGNIASGKSSVQSILEQKGFKVLDTDKIAHELLDKLTEIKKAFKDYDIFQGDKICREKLGKLVFSNTALKNTLESIMHPAIRVEIEKYFEQNKSETLVFVGIPLLFESDMFDMFDKALLIFTDDEIRLQRLLSRNQYSPEYAKKRMQAQISQEDKLPLCDYVIYNNGNFSDLENSVNEFLSKF